MHEVWIGKKVRKKSGRPFKSGRKRNTVASVIDPILHKPAFTFVEDDSFVAKKSCMLVSGPDSHLFRVLGFTDKIFETYRDHFLVQMATQILVRDEVCKNPFGLGVGFATPGEALAAIDTLFWRPYERTKTPAVGSSALRSAAGDARRDA